MAAKTLLLAYLIMTAQLFGIVHAVEPVNPGQGPIDLPPPPGNLGAPREIITTLIERLLPVALILAGFLTVIIIVVSGIQFATSSGNPEAAAAARGRLTFALVGFGLIILAYAIARIVDIAFLGGSRIFPAFP